MAIESNTKALLPVTSTITGSSRDTITEASIITL